MFKKNPTKPISRIFVYKVAGLMCSDCSQTVKSFLQNLSKDPDYKVYVNWANEEISVEVAETNPQSDKEIRKKIQEALDAYDIKPAAPIWHYIVKGIMGTTIGLVLLILMASGFPIPMFAMYIIGSLSTLVTLYLGFDSYKSAFKDLFKSHKLTMDTLFTVSTLTALGVSIAAFFVPWLTMMFDAPLLILGLGHLGKAIEQKAKRKVLKGIDFRDRTPRTIEKLEMLEGVEQRKVVEVNTLKVGDTIIVPGGGVIPVDSECADERSSVYNTIYKGNTEPTKIVRGEKLRSGMRVDNKMDNLRVTVTAEASDSYLTRLDKSMDKAKQENMAKKSKINTFRRYFIPGILLFTVIAAVIIGCLFPPVLAIQCIITTLVCACPCPIGIIEPIANEIGKKKGQEQGIEFKNDEDIKAAAEVDTVVFDLNGTLTTGIKEITSVVAKDECFKREQLLEYMYLLEKNFRNTHAVAKAIYDYAKKEKPQWQKIPSKVTDLTKYGKGVAAKIDGNDYALGNRTMMLQDIGIAAEELIIDNQAGDVTYLACNKKIIGTIHKTDPLRPDAIDTIKALRMLTTKGKKIDIYIASGSDAATIKIVAENLGIDSSHIYADCLPIEENDKNEANKNNTVNKLQVIQSLQAQGRHVLMVGDGGNDAPPMSKCLGVVMKSDLSDEATEDNAGMVIHTSLLMPVVAGLIIAKRTIRNIKISFGVSVAFNLSALLISSAVILAIGFAINPAVGVALMVVQFLLILGIAYYYKQKAPVLLGKTFSPLSVIEKSTPAFLNRIFNISAKPTVKLSADKNPCDNLSSFPSLAHLPVLVRGFFGASRQDVDKSATMIKTESIRLRRQQHV